MYNQICNRMKILFVSIIGVFRRAMCCFSRRRRSSVTEIGQLESVNVVIDYPAQGKSGEEIPEIDWNSWDDGPRTVREHIDRFRQRLMKPPTPEPGEPEPDYFQDMTPKIKPPPKMIINMETQKADFSRLEAKTDIPIPIQADLEDWEDEEQLKQFGWDELDAEKTKQLIREKRKEIRSQRQAAKFKEKMNNPHQYHQPSFAERIPVSRSS